MSYRKRIPFLVMFRFNHCLNVDLYRLFVFKSIDECIHHADAMGKFDYIII